MERVAIGNLTDCLPVALCWSQPPAWLTLIPLSYKLDRHHLYHCLPGLASTGCDTLTYANSSHYAPHQCAVSAMAFIRSFVDGKETNVLGELGCAYIGRSH